MCDYEMLDASAFPAEPFTDYRAAQTATREPGLNFFLRSPLGCLMAPMDMAHDRKVPVTVAGGRAFVTRTGDTAWKLTR